MGTQGGGIQGLGWLVAYKWDQLEADIAQTYGENAAELTMRALLIRVDGLPDTARLAGYDGWGADRELAAQTVEVLDLVRRQIAALTGAKKSKLGKPLHLPRPAALEPKKKRRLSWREFADRINRKDL